MAKKTIELLKGCASAEEIMEVLTSVALQLGDVTDDMDALQIVPLKGAMTNEVFQINWPTRNGDSLRKVLVRLYGEGVEIFFNREEEVRTFECVSQHGHGPRLLGRFSTGRVEEFIHARTLSAADLRDPEISALIASKMREFHNLHMPGPMKVQLWQRMRNWLSQAKRLCSSKDIKKFGLKYLDEELNVLETSSERCQEIGFCHNDLQYGNIMMDEETRSITIIDYEYASYNPIAYDLANHFCEMAANYHTDTPHVLDYSKYPNLEERKRFVRSYLSSGGKKPSDEEVEQLVEDVEKYTLANHLFWGLWGLISSYVNKIDFDYREYASQRFRQYWLRKHILLDTTHSATCMDL
ncbi:probable choline kinase 1 [Prosopis cineraria]|uniref:probable choline kinase 1 n=1 Tax=Prosopis cineraria TaxID=364024 RepID=UPI00240FA409|nr:probable choline kinase 1 [Prosopis cineraria]XP_054776311.1 probable choline kinase 1 [Prosopis cineraria]XP_054776317.1 probable choline kinase 1 [Prosopis cineraria]XP_054776321.1 probable choline kinase 1 [Prosopis cineraria]XP_054776328.1 probable choline kinase 1 [Prosopis cineraria]XP_054776337.1 probable choline kinase 1 [Prosopis cineraria]